jgi:hypothetical protein
MEDWVLFLEKLEEKCGQLANKKESEEHWEINT